MKFGYWGTIQFKRCSRCCNRVWNLKKIRWGVAKKKWDSFVTSKGGGNNRSFLKNKKA